MGHSISKDIRCRARTCGVVVKTAVFGAADPVSNPLGGEILVPFSEQSERVRLWWSLQVVTTACWEVASPVILRLGGKSHVAECDSEGVCTHLGASLVKVNKNQKALPNLPVHWAGRVAARKN